MLSFGCGNQRPPQIQKPKIQLEHSSPIVALVGEKTIRQEDIWPALIELAGEEVVQDAINSMLIAVELEERSIQLRQHCIEQEWAYLLETDPTLNQERFKNQLKKKGVGKKRLHDLLQRTSSLRLLIEDAVSVTEDQTRRMYEIVHGTKYPIHIIVLSTLDEANIIHQKLQRGGSFTELARANSIDPSAKLGGDIGSITMADPIWPEPIRKALPKLKLGTCSMPIFIGDRWAILSLSSIPTVSNVPFETVETKMKHLAKLAQERFLMERALTTLQNKTTIQYFDTDIRRVLGSN